MYVLRCMQYVFDICITELTVYYGQILVWFGTNSIPQGTIELILQDAFGPVRYGHDSEHSYHSDYQCKINMLIVLYVTLHIGV